MFGRICEDWLPVSQAPFGLVADMEAAESEKEFGQEIGWKDAQDYRGCQPVEQQQDVKQSKKILDGSRTWVDKMNWFDAVGLTAVLVEKKDEEQELELGSLVLPWIQDDQVSDDSTEDNMVPLETWSGLQLLQSLPGNRMAGRDRRQTGGQEIEKPDVLKDLSGENVEGSTADSCLKNTITFQIQLGSGRAVAQTQGSGQWWAEVDEGSLGDGGQLEVFGGTGNQKRSGAGRVGSASTAP